jgi:NitT/TauT family transport system permease protein
LGPPILPLAGLAAFLLVWQGAVSATRPAPVRPVTIAFSTPRDDETCVVVLGARGDVALRARLALATVALPEAGERLRTWLGASQPTLAALPPAAPAALRDVIDRARREFGGGFETAELALALEADPCAEAEQRARSAQRAHVTRASWLPGPAEALGALGAMARSGELPRHVVASVFRVAAGFTIAVALGIPFGLALGSFAWLHGFANAGIQLLRPISPIAWLPVATLALGGGDLAAIFLIFLAAFFPIAVSTAAAVATVDLKYRRSAANFGVRGVDFAQRVLVPATLPSILTALRIAVGVAWLVVVAAEMLGVESGLGYLVLDARNQLRYDRVVAAMIVIGAIGLAIDLVVRRFERAELERRGLGAR